MPTVAKPEKLPLCIQAKEDYKLATEIADDCGKSINVSYKREIKLVHVGCEASEFIGSRHRCTGYEIRVKLI